MSSTAVSEPDVVLERSADASAPAQFGNRSLTLDGLRGVAILLVMFGHFRSLGFFLLYYRNDSEAWRYLDLPGRLFDKFGWSGVDLFFVLSGFLITGILYDAKNSPHYFRNFYMRRSLRIFPAYYTMLLIFMIILPMFAPMFMYRAKMVLRMSQWPMWTYSSNYAIAYEGTISGAPGALGHTWSLAVEEQFYLVWPAVAFFLSRVQLIRLCVALAVLMPVLRFFLVLTGSRSLVLLAELGSIARLDTLAMGGLLAILYRTPSVWPRVLKWCWPVIVVSALGAWALTDWHSMWKGGGTALWRSLRYTCVMFTYSGMLALSISALPGSVGFRILGSAFLRFFGKFSYGIYLYHWPALFVVRFWMVDKAVGLIPGPRTIGSALPGSVLVIVLTISMALASWYLVEKPLLKLKRFFPMFKMT